MKRILKTRTWLCCGLIAVCASAAQAYDVNKDLRNSGPPAYDIEVVLEGQETVTQTYDGYSNGHFGTVLLGSLLTGDTFIHWQGFTDGGNNIIDTGQVIHVGWSTADGTCKIKDMFWTDINGNRIPGSKVENITPDINVGGNGVIGVWINDNSLNLVQIGNVSFGLFPTGQLPLGVLNMRNTALNAQLMPVPAGNFELMPGQVRPLPLPIPNPPPPGMSLVLRYSVLGPGSSAQAIDYVQVALGRRCVRGDSNCDGVVNNFDIDCFVLALTQGQAAWQQHCGAAGCDYLCANDINGDGHVDNFDIQAMVACLTNGCP